MSDDVLSFQTENRYRLNFGETPPYSSNHNPFRSSRHRAVDGALTVCGARPPDDNKFRKPDRIPQRRGYWER